MKNKKNEIKVGITVFTAFVIFISVLVWAKNYSFSSNQFKVNVKFDNISGLYIKDKVTVNGLEKGFVNQLHLLPEGVIAELILEDDVLLKQDAKFSIVMLDLMGGKKIEISPGISEKEINLDEIQKGNFAGDISSTMAIFTSIQEDLLTTIKQTRDLTTQLNSLISEDNFVNDLKTTLTKTNKILDSFSKLVDNNQYSLKKLAKNSAEFSDSLLTFWNANNQQISNVINQSNGLFSQTQKLVQEIKNILDETKSKNNNLGKILYEDKYITKIDTTLKQLNQLTKILIKQLQSEGINVKTNIL